MSEYVSFSKYGARLAGEMTWQSDVLVFLRGKPCKELATRGAREVPAQLLVTSLYVHVYVCFCEQQGFTSSWRGALDLRGSYVQVLGSGETGIHGAGTA